jgi:hypothetical protein
MRRPSRGTPTGPATICEAPLRGSCFFGIAKHPCGTRRQSSTLLSPAHSPSLGNRSCRGDAHRPLRGYHPPMNNPQYRRMISESGKAYFFPLLETYQTRLHDLSHPPDADRSAGSTSKPGAGRASAGCAVTGRGETAPARAGRRRPGRGLSAGAYHTCGLKSDGTLACWGAGTTNTGVISEYGQSMPPTRPSPRSARAVTIPAG